MINPIQIVLTKQVGSGGVGRDYQVTRFNTYASLRQIKDFLRGAPWPDGKDIWKTDQPAVTIDDHEHVVRVIWAKEGRYVYVDGTWNKGL